MSDITLRINPDYPGLGVRYVTTETTVDRVTGETKPILELTDTGDKVLHVSFVRSTAERSLDSLLTSALCYASANGYERVELEDDAQFPSIEGVDCIHRALFRRVFDGKRGIYESKGWIPAADTGPLVATIASYSLEQARELLPIFDAVRSSEHNELLRKAAEAMPFGAWINKQPCAALNHFYTTLMILSTSRWLSKLEVSPATRGFLQALHEYKKANEVLVHDPICKTSGGGRIRRKSSSTRRFSNKRRKPRSRRRNRKTSSRRQRH